MDEIIGQVVAASRALAAAGQGDMVWGHVAIRDPAGRGVWLKAAGWGLEEVEADRVVLVAPSGEVLAGTGPRHIEYHIHAEIMRARPDVGCTVHTHAPAVNAFSSLGVPIRPISHDGVLFAEPDVPRFAGTANLIRTAELGAALASTLGSAPACLMPQHGLVTAGADAAAAVMYAVLLARACEVQLLAMSAGGPRYWTNGEELAAKRAEVWAPGQLSAGWEYLTRRAGP